MYSCIFCYILKRKKSPTGEMQHHDVLDAAQKGISVILTNHSDSERGFLKVFSSDLQNKLENRVSVLVSKCDRDPLETI